MQLRKDMRICHVAVLATRDIDFVKVEWVYGVGEWG